MKRSLIFAAMIVMILCLASSVCAANPDDVLGHWWSKDKKAKVEIYKYKDTYAGRIVALKDPLYPADDPKGMGGKPKMDRENPDPSKKNEPLTGMVMVWGFTPAGDNRWENGSIYNPENGKTYRCKMTLESKDILKVRGFIGFSFIGETQTWTRVR